MKVYKAAYRTDLTNLNMMGASGCKALRVSGFEALLFIVPVVVIVGAVFASVVPDLGFIAECQNIPGGDFCTISLR